MRLFKSEGAQERPAVEEMLDFIHESPTMFHAAASIRARLDEAGFVYLPEGARWGIRPGGAYYTQRNGSSVVAWRVGAQVPSAGTDAGNALRADGDSPADEGAPQPGSLTEPHAAASVDGGAAPYHFQLTASHSDSPCFKVKMAGEVEGPNDYLRLNTEAYGGMMDYTWFDRPLSLAGRVLVREGARIESRLVALNRDVALVPSLAIHMNHEVNKAFSPNRASDLYPLVSAGDLAAGSLDTLLADALEVDPAQIVARDLFLVNHERGRVWGATDEFVSSPRLDDLMCAYTSLAAFIASANERVISVYACFDNEEVGSETKQGAASTLLADALTRLNLALGYTDEDLRRALSASMLVSCDNAHAMHPAHPEKADEANAPKLNGGLAVKEAANQHYCTDAFSRAAFMAVLDQAGAAYQGYANRSDMAGGSTLGNISNMQVSLHAVDVGCAQLAMHSCVETAGARDVELAIEALTAFYNADLRIIGADSIELA